MAEMRQIGAESKFTHPMRVWLKSDAERVANNASGKKPPEA